MKSLALPAIAGISIVLASCAAERPGLWGGGGSLGYNPYYDDSYGPFDDGYWGGDGAFYLRDHGDHGFAPDGGGPLHHAPAGGFHGVRAIGGRR